MTNFIEQISNDLTKANIQNYWTNFELVAYGLFDEKNVYLFNHPNYCGNTYQIVTKDDQFIGCTLILFEEYPTAIIDMRLYDEYEELYSLVVHELFHGYQYIRGENRFPDEIMGMTYPLLQENIELRSRERKMLYNAVLLDDLAEKRKCINEFITIREKRADKMKEYLLYENFTETIEGPAFYIEFKAYTQMSTSRTTHNILEKYAEILLNEHESSLYIRKSCYGSGLFLCLLLDEIAPKWHESFLKSNISLYEFFKQHVQDFEKISLNNVIESVETEEITNEIIKYRQGMFDEFNNQLGVHLYIQGEIKVKSFDPMNVIVMEDKALHQNFIKISINKTDYLIQQPSITYYKGNFRNISELHIVLENTPVQRKDSLFIEGIGEVKGSYKKSVNSILVIVN